MTSFLLTLCTLLPTLHAQAISPSAWPTWDTSGTDISQDILAYDSGFEPSGISWHKDRQTFFVADDGGNLAEITETGSLEHIWNTGLNLEGVAIPERTGDAVYLVDENTNVIHAFSLTTETISGTTWDISPYLSYANNLGIEGLEWIPDGQHAFGTTPMGGIFLCGWQNDGNLYAFIPDAQGGVTAKGGIVTSVDYTDVAGIDYNPDTQSIFSVYDSWDMLQEYSPTGGNEVAEYTMPSSDQEGIAVVTDCTTELSTVTIADDAGHIFTYKDFPTPCVAPVDADGDGVSATYDCNDNDATIATNVTYYRDGDGDGYGNLLQSGSFCQNTPPQGYVTNSSDLYDTAKIELSGDGSDNDGDARSDEWNTLQENGLHPLYSLEDPKTSTAIVGFSMYQGSILVHYRDTSVFRYNAMPQNLGACVATPIQATSYVLIGCGTKYRIMQGLTGELRDQGTFATRKGATLWGNSLVATW